MDINLHYEEGCGWKPSAHGVINGKTVSYNGEYQPTYDEASARAKRALGILDLMDLTA